MKPRLIDVHTHTQFAEFDIDRDAVICRALDAGIWMINVGTDRRMSESAIGLASKYEIGGFATAGLHPTEIHKKFDYDFYKKLAEAPKFVAIGECGLDYYRVAKHKTRNLKQKKAFEAQIELAHKLKKPLMIHCREAFTDLIKMLQVSRSKLRDNNPGVCHFFSGSSSHIFFANFILEKGGLDMARIFLIASGFFTDNVVSSELKRNGHEVFLPDLEESTVREYILRFSETRNIDLAVAFNYRYTREIDIMDFAREVRKQSPSCRTLFVISGITEAIENEAKEMGIKIVDMNEVFYTLMPAIKEALSS